MPRQRENAEFIIEAREAYGRAFRVSVTWLFKYIVIITKL